MKQFTFILFFTACMIQPTFAQMWQQDNSVFNPSGIPSLTFSQPRFADLDGDGVNDILLGNTNRSPIFIENTGSISTPAYHIGTDFTADISSLDAEMGVCADMDADGDLDLITGGFTGLHLFVNDGSPTSPLFSWSLEYFNGLNVGSNPVPDMADVDNDGDFDMVVGLSESGIVKLYINTGTPTIQPFSESDMQVIGDVGLYAYPVFCDLDNDSDQDILVGRDSHGFIYYQNIGNSSVGNWQPNNALFAGLGSDTYWNSPDLADLNNDGKDDLIYGTAEGPLQYHVNVGTTSNPAWQVNTSLFGGVIDVGGASNPVFSDFDGDGDLDMISGSQLGTIRYYQNTGNLHAPAWEENSSYFASIDHSIYAAVAIGDVDGDDLSDAIIGDLNGGLYYHHNTGTGFVQINGFLEFVSLGGWSCPRLIDMDGDGDLDIAVGNEAGNLHYYQNQGTQTVPDWVEISGFFGTIDIGSNCVPAFGDIDLDGDIDFIAGNLFGNLRCYLKSSHNWVENTTILTGITTDQNATPALVDLDYDGDLDLVLGDYDGTFSYYRNLTYSANVLNPPQNLSVQTIGNEALLTWNSPVSGSTSPFQFYRVFLNGVSVALPSDTTHTLQNLTNGAYTIFVTAQYVAGSSAPVEAQLTEINENLQIPIVLQNGPNPFKVVTTIRFNMPKSSLVNLTIYNTKGQRVRCLIGGSMNRGEHTVTWDGKDGSGKTVSSGVYFSRLEADGLLVTKKMVMIK